MGKAGTIRTKIHIPANAIINPQDLLDELKNIINQNKFLCLDNNVLIRNNIKDNIIVSMDKLRIEEVFNNLINNSIKYAKDFGTITFDAMVENDFVLISVNDDGIGMDEEQIRQIFDEFYKADPARHDFDSSGLGMPICKRIIEKHGGRIWAESDGIGRGTTIKFTLPFEQQNEVMHDEKNYVS